MKNSISVAVALLVMLTAAPFCFGKDKPTGKDLYAVVPPPLTVAQCGQCHTNIFKDLKEAGGKHQFDCHRCHLQFHDYNPVKNNWAELMPKCLRCHKKPPHGKQFTHCLECHTNPHTPLKIPMNNLLTSSCGKCHPAQAKQLAKFPSPHTQVGCPNCHTVHGQIPSCLDCHTPHLPKLKMKDCLTCHPAHAPLQISYDSDANPAICGSCHKHEYTEWKATKSKHGQLTCAMCHSRHGFIPKCTSCHGKPHGAALLKKFKGCLVCHLDPHNLPVKK